MNCDPVDWSAWHDGMQIDLIIVGGGNIYHFNVNPVYYGLFTITGSNSWPGGPTRWIGAYYCDQHWYDVAQSYRGFPLIGGHYAQNDRNMPGMFYLNLTYGQSNVMDRVGAYKL